MANLITLSRFLLLFLLVASAYSAPPVWQLGNAPLLFLIIALDGVDGYVARKRNETSVFGSIFDIAIDRVVENVLWVVLADLGLVPIWVAIVFITRSSIVDFDPLRGNFARRDRFRQHPLPVGPPPRVGPLHARILWCPQSNHFWLGVLSPAASDPLTECLASLQRADALDHRLPGLCLRGDLFAPCAACDPRVSQRSSPVPAHETGWGVVTCLVIIDLDGTLLRGGSEIRFIGHLAATRRIGPSALQRSVAFTLRYAPRFGRDVWKKNKAYLAGLSDSEVEDWGRSFALDSLLPLLRQSLLDRIARHRARADQVVLMTGTPEFLARPLAEAIGADLCIATQCRQENGRYIAAPPLLHPFAREKLTLASEAAKRLGLSLAESIAYADSRDDIQLLSRVGTAVAVAPDRELARHARVHGWEIISDPQIRPLRRMFAWAGERS